MTSLIVITAIVSFLIGSSVGLFTAAVCHAAEDSTRREDEIDA